jgi:hypothetical protein
MKQLVHETDKLAISTVKLGAELDPLDDLLGLNPKHLPYETMVFPLVDGQPDFSSPIETKSYATQAEAQAGHQAMIQKYALVS